LNRKAIIIGASSGIGRELAVQLINLGYITAITGRRKELLDEIKCLYPESTLTFAFDISDSPNSLMMQSIVDMLGGLDLCIISAGTGEFNIKLEYETELQTLKTNINGFTEIADWCYNLFRKQGHGHLVAITSIAGLFGNALAPAYNASKAYQMIYIESLRKRSIKYKRKIIITDIRPGFVDTAMAKGEGLFWVAPVHKAAGQIMRGIRKKKSIVYITRRWSVIAFLIKILPRFIFERM
jgi:short-subunit dehydrogenase